MISGAMHGRDSRGDGDRYEDSAGGRRRALPGKKRQSVNQRSQRCAHQDKADGIRETSMIKMDRRSLMTGLIATPALSRLSAADAQAELIEHSGRGLSKARPYLAEIILRPLKMAANETLDILPDPI